ncbi:Faf1 protein [Saccharomycopsis crataegensis]|uniref:Faf1 protein n=1 Tax=Saccharomycopsis crataegensis TaxID=43959 RepID=A0AAV5QK68_9ASCO|nr:Faf1 protein [Saccharomycopsis crataegensis]
MSNEDSEYLSLLELQRKNFEAQFGSLESIGYEDKSKNVHDSESSESDSEEQSSTSESQSEEEEEQQQEEEDEEFHGFSDYDQEVSDEESESNNEPAPVVVKFSDSTRASSNVPLKNSSKFSRKGKIPSLQSMEIKEQLQQIEIESELLKGGTSKEDMENMQKDIELQRLLSESHILSSASSSSQYSGADLTMKTIDADPFGKTRAKTMTQRLRNLSETTAGQSRKLEKMPMNMRKGILKKEVERVRKFEESAKNSGTILAKTGKYELRDLNMGRANKVGIKSDLIGKHTIGRKKLQEQFSHRKKGLQIQAVGRSTRNGLIVSEKEFSSMIGSGNKGKRGKKRR